MACIIDQYNQFLLFKRTLWQQVYQSKGMKELYPWQAAALESGESGANLVYCAPTSGGKTLVAEILMIRKLLATATQDKARKKKV